MSYSSRLLLYRSLTGHNFETGVISASNSEMQGAMLISYRRLHAKSSKEAVLM